MSCAGQYKLFECSRVLSSCFNAYVLSTLKYCAPMCISSAESRLSLVDRAIRSAEMLCEAELCTLRHRSRVSEFAL